MAASQAGDPHDETRDVRLPPHTPSAPQPTSVGAALPGAPVVVAHGGAGAAAELEDGCLHAVHAGAAALRNCLDAMSAAIAAVVALEADGRFNAGSGASIRLDGETVELDAAVMDSTGRLGAVAGLQHARHPVLVAQQVSTTPHWLLVGAGAQAFAAQFSLTGNHVPSETARKRHAERMAALANTWRAAGEKAGPMQRFWNYAMPWEDAMKRWGSGTVGAVVRDADGRFAVATSTGGSMPALRGRVGDTPIVGCGFYAGPAGAVAATGIGEAIVRTLLAATVYRWIEADVPLDEALARGIARIPSDVDVGLIAVSASEAGGASNHGMPWCQGTP